MDKSVTVSLLYVSGWYLILTSSSALFVYLNTKHLEPKLSTKPELDSVVILCAYSSELAGCLNQSMNFFLYILGSAVFRKQFFKMLKINKDDESGAGPATCNRK